MTEIKQQQIYQYQETPKTTSRSRMEYSPCGVYVYVKTVRDSIARCKVLVIQTQPTGEKFKLNSWVYIPVGNLTDSDLFPAYTHNPARWTSLVKKPIKDAAIEVLNDMIEGDEVVTADVKKTDLKVGQIWRTDNQKMTIEKQFEQYLIVKDKYGDRKRYLRQELTDLFNLYHFKKDKAFDTSAILRAVVFILLPVVGVAAMTGLLKTIESYIRK